MAQAGFINNVWRNTKALFTGRRDHITGKRQRDTGAAPQISLLADELPLYTDGFSNHMRALREPFFS